MNKRVILALFAVVMMMALTGCCLSHEWNKATCTAPKTCAKCGETEGEVLAHTWVESTCAEAKHCSVCGETEGEALAHMWVEATCEEAKHCSVCGEIEGEALAHTLTEVNYQQASMCTVCGAIEGEPLQADFEKYELTENLVELDKEYDCVTMCDSSHTTVGKILFSNYQSFTSGTPEKPGNFTINSELPEEPGYEYKVVDVTVSFSDENALTYGASVYPFWDNYYDIAGFESSYYRRDDGWSQFAVNWNGIEYAECLAISLGEWITNDDNTYFYNAIFIARVPVDYDGLVLGFRNAQEEWGEGQYIFDLDNTDTVFFRFD